MTDISRLLNIMAQLRDPQRGCPWDKEQTFHTIVPHTLEEAYEVADAIERNDAKALCDELGDLLFQIVFYVQLAREQNLFDFADVVTSICDKLVRRHPHVFGDVQIKDAAEQTEHWEKLKAQERSDALQQTDQSALAGMTRNLPALNHAQKLQKRAARVGFDWPDKTGVLNKIQEEIQELLQDWQDTQKRSEELGDVLFSCVNLARHAEVDAETALRGANRKFEQRFRTVEQILATQGIALASASMEQMEQAWQLAKQQLQQ